MAIPSKNVLGNPNVTEGNFQIAIEQLRESVIGSGKTYDSANTYMAHDICYYSGVVYYSKIDSNIGNTPSIGANWGDYADLLLGVVHKTGNETVAGVKVFSSDIIFSSKVQQNTPGTSNIYLRNLVGYNRIDSYNDPITGTYPLVINSSELRLQIGDSNALLVDANKNVLVVSGGLGYGTGAGGTVTQLTSKSTSVTLNKPCGQITMNNAPLPAGETVLFAFNNSLVTQSDQLLVELNNNFGGSYSIRSYISAISGVVGIHLTNVTGATLSDSVTFNFIVLKGATA